jgi:hypothetical protein
MVLTYGSGDAGGDVAFYGLQGINARKLEVKNCLNSTIFNEKLIKEK